MVGVRDGVREKMMLSEFESHLGSNHFLEQDTAITHIFHKMLNPAICIYNCPLRAWKECQNLPKSSQPIPLHASLLAPITAVSNTIPSISPQDLLHQLGDPAQAFPLLIDVREPVEFAESHLRHAQHIPMPYLIENHEELVPRDTAVIFICRTGRRSHQVVHILRQKGYEHVAHVAGGMVGLELADMS
jgi:SulP family sulfate permease